MQIPFKILRIDCDLTCDRIILCLEDHLIIFPPITTILLSSQTNAENCISFSGHLRPLVLLPFILN